MQFSDNFVWGAASAAYQIEGGAFEDGKGPRRSGIIFHMCPERLSMDIPVILPVTPIIGQRRTWI